MTMGMLWGGTGVAGVILAQQGITLESVRHKATAELAEQGQCRSRGLVGALAVGSTGWPQSIMATNVGADIRAAGPVKRRPDVGQSAA